jgi:hypothetical protein
MVGKGMRADRLEKIKRRDAEMQRSLSFFVLSGGMFGDLRLN